MCSFEGGRRPGFAVVLTIVSLVAVPSARAVVIDDFEVGSFSITQGEPLSVVHPQTGLAPANVVGGERTSIFDVGTTANVGLSLVTDTTPTIDNAAVLDVPAFGRGNWTGAYLTGIDDVDLTAGGRAAVRFTIAEAPASGVQIGLFVANRPLPGHRANHWMSVAGPGTYDIAFSDLAAFPDESLPDLTAVDELAIYVQAQAGATPVRVAVADVRAVPEPAIAGVLATVAGLVGMRRRRGRGRHA